MKMDLGAFSDDVPVQSQASVQRTAPANLMAMLSSLSAQVRQLNGRLQRIEKAIPTLAQNDKTTSDYVNRLGDLVAKVNTKTDQAVAALRAFARGGGVQPQQYVPKASDAVVAYDTPPRAVPQARASFPGTDDGPDSAPVDPGTEDDSAVEIDQADYNDALFHGMIGDDE